MCSCEQALGASAEPALDVGTATGAEDEPLRTPQRAAAPSAAALQQPPASEDGSDVTAPTPGSDVGRLSIDVRPATVWCTARGRQAPPRRPQRRRGPATSRRYQLFPPPHVARSCAAGIALGALAAGGRAAVALQVVGAPYGAPRRRAAPPVWSGRRRGACAGRRQQGLLSAAVPASAACWAAPPLRPCFACIALQHASCITSCILLHRSHLPQRRPSLASPAAACSRWLTTSCALCASASCCKAACSCLPATSASTPTSLGITKPRWGAWGRPAWAALPCSSMHPGAPACRYPAAAGVGRCAWPEEAAGRLVHGAGHVDAPSALS